MLEVNTIIHALKNNEYPSDGKDSWGVGFELTDGMDNERFLISPALYSSVVAAKGLLCELDDDVPRPQFILNYKNRKWWLKFEFYDNSATIDENISCNLEIDLIKVRNLLARLKIEGTRVYDVNYDTVM